MKNIVVLLLCFISILSFGQSTFEKKIYTNAEGKNLPYQILYPTQYNPKLKYPVVIVLHGSGERGDDNVAQMKYGTEVFLKAENQEKYPAIVIFPQCPKDSYWANVSIERGKVPMQIGFDYPEKPTWALQSVIDIVQDLVKNKIAHKKRLYIMGLSMGGMGTMEAVTRNPKMFAAAIPICGGADLSYVKKYAKKMPFWIHHGDADSVVPVRHSRELVAALKESGGDVRYTEYPGVNHNSWVNTFAQPDLLAWLFSHKR